MTNTSADSHPIQIPNEKKVSKKKQQEKVCAVLHYLSPLRANPVYHRTHCKQLNFRKELIFVNFTTRKMLRKISAANISPYAEEYKAYPTYTQCH